MVRNLHESVSRLLCVVRYGRYHPKRADRDVSSDVTALCGSSLLCVVRYGRYHPKRADPVRIIENPTVTSVPLPNQKFIN